MNKNFYYALLVLVSLFAINANGAPWAYSVNSDSGSSNEDSLYQINLATGEDHRKGELISVTLYDHIDTEGLAFDSDNTLWGIDDATLTLFPINTVSGAIPFGEIIDVSTVFPSGGANDFGMTFSCDNSLYVTSVITDTLYRIDLDAGSEEAIGALGANISAIAAIGSPTKLYGLGNGQFVSGDTDSPDLYSIDASTGAATLIGPLGSEAGEYNQGGLAFDSDGTLWAITDRRVINGDIADLSSQILRIDVDTGTATLVSTTSEVGFESLAIGPPTACSITRDTDDEDEDEFQGIPTLNQSGRLLAIFVLMLAGILTLRRRFS
jgi:hypothetical protein